MRQNPFILRAPRTFIPVKPSRKVVFAWSYVMAECCHDNVVMTETPPAMMSDAVICLLWRMAPWAHCCARLDGAQAPPIWDISVPPWDALSLLRVLNLDWLRQILGAVVGP